MLRKEMQSLNKAVLHVSVSNDVLENQQTELSTTKNQPKDTSSSPSTIENCQNQQSQLPSNNMPGISTSTQSQKPPTSKTTESIGSHAETTHHVLTSVTETGSEKDSLSQPSNGNNLNDEPSIPFAENQQKKLPSTPSIKQSEASSDNAQNRPTTSTKTQQSNEPPVTKNITFEHSYKTPSALSKAVAKTKQSLPSSPSKRKAVIARLLRMFSEEDQRDIIGNAKLKENGSTKGLSEELIRQIRLFYELDNVSRISPNVKDSRKFINPDTGKKEVRQIRHLSHKLSEVYSMFLEEHKGV